MMNVDYFENSLRKTSSSILTSWDRRVALLSATLRTYQKAACDSDQVVIACPRGTSISIEFAQYNNFENKDGFSIDDLCPFNTSAKKVQSKAKHLLRGSTFGTSGSKIPTNQHFYGHTTNIPSTSLSPDRVMTEESEDAGTLTENTSSVNIKDDDSPENCLWPNALQYSLLQTVVEACQKKKHCKFNGAPHYYRLSTGGDTNNRSNTVSTVNVDPCHKRRKIVEVAYKCRPYEFRSKVACHSDVAQLECNPYSRIAVYSASFGRTEYESIQCPQPQGVREETCQASYATETVMQICHGRRRCNLAADANTFGSPCQPNSRMYLKVVYTCVPKQVLKDRYESEVEGDENEEFDGDNEVYDDELNYKESEAIPKVYSNSTVTTAKSNSSNVSTRLGSSISNSSNISFHLEIPDSASINRVMTHSADLSLEDNQERLYLYLLFAGLIGVVVCIIIVSVHVWMQKHQVLSSETQMASIDGSGNPCADTTIPNGFNDTISEIDAEIDMPTSISVPSVLKHEGGAPMLPTSVIGTPASSTMITNPNLSGARQSPDVIGVSSKAHLPVATSSAIGYQMGVGSILAPTIVIGTNGNNSSNSLNCAPMTSVGQYTNAQSLCASYITNADGMLKRPPNLQTPPMLNATPNSQYSATSTLRRMKSTTVPSAFQLQLSYDGTAPRTLSTGVPVNSQFYYG